MTSSAYANIDGRIELEQNKSGNVQRQCKFCGTPLHEHDKERVYPDSGPSETYHYRYECDDGFVPELERDVS
jgi:hypothetical protein